MSRNIRYSIKIVFDRSRPECEIGNYYVKYKGGKEHSDHITLCQNEITIELKRGKKQDLKTLLLNHRNTFYEQVQKSLLVYYAIAHTFPTIEKLFLSINYGTTFEETELGNFIQPITNYNISKKWLSIETAVVIFEDNEKGKTLRSACSYWIKGMASNNQYQRFDKLWRAYDRILLYEGNTTREIDGIRAMRQLITNNALVFSDSISLCQQFSIELKDLSWRSLLLDKPSDISRKIQSYTDHRILKLFQNVITDPKIKNLLSQDNKLDEINNHIELHQETISDIELVCLLSLTYTYYKRCKMFHAAFPDSTFKLFPTSEDDEIESLSNLLETIVSTLLGHHTLLR